MLANIWQCVVLGIVGLGAVTVIYWEMILLDKFVWKRPHRLTLMEVWLIWGIMWCAMSVVMIILLEN